MIRRAAFTLVELMVSTAVVVLLAGMVLDRFDGGFWSPEENVSREVPDDWFEQRGLFTDLNQPVLVPVDAGGAAPPDGAIRVGANLYFANYPILDPTAQTRDAKKRDGIEGFAIDTKRISSAPANPPPADYNPTQITDPRRSPNPAPMPVRWLYVLRDGRLTVPEYAVRGASGLDEMHWKPGGAYSPTRETFATDRKAILDDAYKFRVIRTHRFGR